MKYPDIKEQFKVIYEKESDFLFRYTLTRVSSRDQAIDIVQDVFIELWQMYQKGEEIRNEKAFLFTVLKNRIIDWYRKKKSVSLDAMVEQSEEEGRTPYDPVDAKACSNITLSFEAKALIEAISELEPKYQEVVYLRLVEDLSPKEIGSILNKNTNVVSVSISRGINKLREILRVEELN